MAVQFEQLDLGGYAKINDTTPSAGTTYSSQKIEEILPEAGAVIDDSEASTTKTYSSTHIDETYLKKKGNGSGVSVEYTASDTGSAPASGSMLGNLIGWLVGKCNGIGNISNLLTVAKSNLVAAINELRGEIGDLTQLDTAEKTDLVAAINKLNSNIEALEANNGKVGSALLFRELEDNLTYGCYESGLYAYPGYYTGAPSDWSGLMLVMPQDTTGTRVKVAFSSDCTVYMMRQESNGTISQSWAKV